MIAYKGFSRHEDGTLWCRGFQYEVGKTYKFEGEPVMCKQGFHACHEPHQCWVHYPNNGGTAYCEVECSGKIIESTIGDGKFVCTEITLVREMPAPENKFDWCGYFREGYAIVRLKGKYNHINAEGKYLSEQWWDDCCYFNEGYATVALKGNWNFINAEGKYLSEQWWDDCYSFYNGRAEVKMHGRCYKIDKTGKIIE